MKKEIFLLLFTSLTLIFSCSKSSPEEEIVPPTPAVTSPEIVSLSSNFIIEEQTLIIRGQNFKSNNDKTTLIINNKNYEVTPTNTEILVKITSEMGKGKSSIIIQVGNKKSASESFFIMHKGWQEINTELDIQKAFIFDDTNEITLLADTETSSNSYYGSIIRLSTYLDGYEPTTLSIPGGNKNDLKMFNSKVGATVTSSTGYFTSDGFENSNSFGNFLDNDAYAIETKIISINENSCVIVNCCADYIYTNDKGITSDYSSLWKELAMDNDIRLWSSKKLSDGYFYGAGISLEQSPYTNFIAKSNNGISNWEIIDNKTNPYSIGGQHKILDVNLFLQVFYANKELKKSTDLAKTWTVIKNNVEKVFIKNKTNWFIISDDNKVYSTINSGNTWDLELELPADSKINHMSFSENKILLSGEKILYIKHQ